MGVTSAMTRLTVIGGIMAGIVRSVGSSVDDPPEANEPQIPIPPSAENAR
jgi:hypothetical protein